MKTTKDFKVGDIVTYLPNGLKFKCLDLKMWRRMQDSNQYVKEIPEDKKAPNRNSGRLENFSYR